LNYTRLGGRRNAANLLRQVAFVTAV